MAPSLLALPGVGEITAATIVGETALVERFSSEAAFARHIGVAPVPHSSGQKVGALPIDPLGQSAVEQMRPPSRRYPVAAAWARSGLL